MSVDHPTFLQTAFEKIAYANSYKEPLQELLCSEYITICHDFDLTQIQDSWSWRITHLAREIAFFLIDDKGEFKRRTLIKAIRILQNNLYSLGPNRHHDSKPFSHLLKILQLFFSEQEYMKALRRIRRPDSHQGAEQLIRETLFLSDVERVTDAHARRAALSALLTNLRQNVGSCFATAPAIMIQQEQPLQFLADIGQLLGTGQLKRVYEGVEYAVPLSINWGVGDLYRPLYLSSLGSDPFKTLASSPGLRAALETSVNIEKNLEELIKESCIWLNPDDPFALFTADDILKHIFLQIHGVTEEDVKKYREQPVAGIVGELLVQAPYMREGKSRLCEQFIRSYERAKKVFKGFTDNALLKAWEFSLASLSESKADFAKWNFYASLGIQPEEPFGIGESVHKHLQEKLNRINEEIEAHQSRYDHLYAQVKYLEGRMRRASTPSEAEWLRADYRIRRHELDRVLAEQDEEHEKGKKLAQIFPFLIDFYGKKIRDYFQEVYDSQMQDVTTNPYDDSPAGFRLLYKHGRSNTALWTMIYSSTEYLQHLSSFFSATEIELEQLPEMEGIERDLSELMTAIITTIKRPEFLETSFYRLAKAYREPIIKDPLRHLDQVKRKPWAYISGGTMGTLVSCYYSNPDKPNEERRWIESENELLAFLIDIMKELPLSTQKLYLKDPNRSMLAFSPTHAFLAKPGWKLFRQAWESDLYTYTWIRDLWHNPQLHFLDDHLLDGRMMDYLVSELLRFIPVGYRPLVKNILSSFPYSLRADEFRERTLKALSYEKWLRGKRHLELVAEELDSILYRSFPLFPEHELNKRLYTLFEALEDIDEKTQTKLYKQIEELETGRYKIFSANDLRNIAKGLLIRVLGSTRSSIPFHQRITEVMQANKLAYPAPILVADTNWVKNTFGFTVNPGTGKLEFWRFDDCGGEGRPIAIWRRYLDGTDRQDWGLYTNPSQYGQFL